MTMCYAHLVTGHLHQAMADFDTKVGTKTGTVRTAFPGNVSSDVPARI
jgi:hypothetical protein